MRRKIEGLTELALGLVLISAVAHAGWNFIAKRASGGPTFNWLFDVLSVVVCLPLGIAQVVLVPPRSLALTTSGKLSRAATQAAYLDGSLRDLDFADVEDATAVLATA